MTDSLFPERFPGTSDTTASNQKTTNKYRQRDPDLLPDDPAARTVRQLASNSKPTAFTETTVIKLSGATRRRVEKAIDEAVDAGLLRICSQQPFDKRDAFWIGTAKARSSG